MKFKSNSIHLFLGLSVLLALASGFITYYSTREKEELVQTVIKRYKSVNASEHLLSLLKDMEAGQRGYLITGDSDFPEPYSEARGKITAATDTLHKLAPVLRPLRPWRF
jgi:CHASE3 domain sensor protein